MHPRYSVNMNIEMTGRSQTLLWWLGGEGVKKTESKTHCGRYRQALTCLTVKSKAVCILNALADKGWVVFIVQPISTTRKMLAF